MYQFSWLRQFIRRRTKPIPENKAHFWKSRLSLVYAFIAWNAFGYVCYMVYTGRADWAKHYGYKSEEESSLTPAQHWTKTLGIKNATVYRVSGLKVHKYGIHNDFENNTSDTINLDSNDKTTEDKNNIN